MQSTPLTLQETDDGDLFFDLPDALLDAMDWREGDTINIEVVAGRIILSRVDPTEGGTETA